MDVVNSRFRLLDAPIAAPGTCILCKSAGGDERKFIDLGIQVDWYGAIYFCTFCITEAAQILGLRSVENIEQISASYNEMVQNYNDLLTLSREMESATRLLLRNCNCEPVVNFEPMSPVDVEADPNANSNDSDFDESSSVEESGDISEAPGDEFDGLPVVKSSGRSRVSKSTKR